MWQVSVTEYWEFKLIALWFVYSMYHNRYYFNSSLYENNTTIPVRRRSATSDIPAIMGLWVLGVCVFLVGTGIDNSLLYISHSMDAFEAVRDSMYADITVSAVKIFLLLQTSYCFESFESFGHCFLILQGLRRAHFFHDPQRC